MSIDAVTDQGTDRQYIETNIYTEDRATVTTEPQNSAQAEASGRPNISGGLHSIIRKHVPEIRLEQERSEDRWRISTQSDCRNH